MPRPLGIDATLRVTPIDRTADAVWDAVEAAVAAGWTPERFKCEAAEAWSHELHENAKYAQEVLNAR